MSDRIPFNKPGLVGRELEYMHQAVERGNLAGDGEFSRRCMSFIKGQYDVRAVLLTPSCTAALEMSMMLLDLTPGDEVILPSFTFVSSASAICRAGGFPRFVDIRPDTLNLDEEKLAAAITRRTRAIMPVHYAGVLCDMPAINSIADRHGLVVVEDAAHAVGSRFAGRSAGAWGSLACYSFHETKNITCGQGGALCINDPSFLTRAEIIRDKGTNRAQYFRGQSDKYTWVDVGSSFVMGELVASYLAAQLEHVDELTEKRRKLYDRYYKSMAPWREEMGLTLPLIPDDCQSNYHIFHLVMETSEDRDQLLKHLNQQDIWAVFHYVPLHSSPRGMSLGYREGDLPLTESIASRLVRLPMYNDLDDETQNRVIEHVHEFFRARVTRRSCVNRVSPASLPKRRSE